MVCSPAAARESSQWAHPDGDIYRGKQLLLVSSVDQVGVFVLALVSCSVLWLSCNSGFQNTSQDTFTPLHLSQGLLSLQAHSKDLRPVAP